MNKIENIFFHINTTVTTAPLQSITINYHTTESDSYVLYTTADDVLFVNAKKVLPVAKVWSTKGLQNASPNSSFYEERYICNALIKNLQSGSYIYKIVSNRQESSVYNFRIEEQKNDFSFLMLADAQYGNNQITHQLVQNLKALSPSSSLVVGSGDLVDFSDKEEEWTNMVDSGIFDNLTLALAPGDHEYWGDDSVKYTQYTAPHTYLATMHYPSNGAASCKGSNYYFKYQNILFIILDMNDSNTSYGPRFDDQVKWFHEVMKETNGQYDFLVVAEHKSLFGSKNIDPAVRNYLTPMWYPIFNEYHVNLVLSGHDHIYSRTHPLAGIEPIVSKKGTIYLDLGTSGNKRRNVDESLLNSDIHAKVIDLKAQADSLGAIVEVNDKVMSVKIYNLAKEVVDEFVIQIE